MRKRSGAIHCQSQQDYLQLAEAAQDKIGIFYDSRVNKKIMNIPYKLKQIQCLPSQFKITTSKHNGQKDYQNYSGFEYGLESNRQRQEREQLQRINLKIQKIQVISIISPNVSKIAAFLRRQLLPNSQQNKHINFDFVLQPGSSSITKYWLIDKQYIKKEPLANLYLKQSLIIMDECEQIKVIKNMTRQNDVKLLDRFKMTYFQ